MNRYLCPDTNLINMELGDYLKRMREAKGLSQKEVAMASKMDMGNYSRIENGKTDPSFSTVVKIADAMGVTIQELFDREKQYKDVSSFDKSLIEKLNLVEQLDKKEKQALFVMLDALVNKKRLKDALTSAVNLTH